MKTTVVLILLILGVFEKSTAQEKATENPLKISGYLETYYVFDFGNPSDHNRPSFFYSFNRHNEMNLNIGFIQADYESDMVRGKLALMSGTYVNANMSHEPDALRPIYEANVGLKLSKDRNLWIDAGVFASHIGFESAMGAVCWNMTRSILAENSPYYLSGAKITYITESEKWLFSGLITNGWQRIRRVEGNQLPAFGHQISYSPNNRITLNSSSFLGSDYPNDLRLMRYFHNLYGIFQVNEKLGLIVGFDIGAQQKETGSTNYNLWYSPILITRYSLSDSWSIGTRIEYYSDKNEVIIATETPNGFQTFAYSMNFDAAVTDNVLWRIEARALSSREDKIFSDRLDNQTRFNSFIGTSLSIGF